MIINSSFFVLLFVITETQALPTIFFMKHSNSSTKDLSALVQKKLKGAKINYPEPNEEVLNKLFETLFFTSLKTEEGQFIKVQLHWLTQITLTHHHHKEL